MLLLYMCMLIDPPLFDGDQDQEKISSSSFSSFAFVMRSEASVSTSIVKKVSVIDILLPLMYMLILIIPSFESFATLDIHSQTSSSVESGPGMSAADTPSNEAITR